MSEMVQVGRLALRAEGSFWNAYYAQVGTMDGALLLGSIKLSAAKSDPSIKEAFMAVMRSCVDLAMKDALGKEPTWGGPKSAPESERSGNA